ncbi:hypothetical protein ABEB36_006086 [Hypothenemus hampei]|uniref:Chitin-binding type-2 domain-containing protein n=1 Tax=Hypothenemus hampei TaxID=57062 RepID=A0ABD1F0U8_HYPHA
MCCDEMKFLLIFMTTACIGVVRVTAITTTHYDRSTIVGLTTNRTATDFNVTLSSSERKKRLLPYQNFYFDQPFNRPHKAGVSAQQYKDFEIVSRPQKKPIRDPVSKDNNLYQSGQRYTPFLESNALPGPFRPIIHTIRPNTPQYIITNKPAATENHNKDSETVRNHVPTDLSAIYEKLAQLKLRQQAMQQQAIPFGYRVVPQYRFRERPQQHYRPNYDVFRHNEIQPSKTTIETFTATNIDIPEKNQELPQEHKYQQVQVPANENLKPYVHQQIAIQVPQVTIRPNTAPNSEVYYSPIKNPTILVRKPEKHLKEPPKAYILIEPNPKQPIALLRKSKPATIVDESYVAEKFVYPKTQSYQQQSPLYVQQEISYQRTPAPIEEPTIAVASPQPIQYQTIAPEPAVLTAYTPINVAHKTEEPNKYEAFPATTSAPVKSSSLAELLKYLQETNTLPNTLTPDNIDNSIKTLVKILNALKDRQKQQKPIVVQDEYEYENEADVDLGSDTLNTPDGGTPGKPGVDYPALSNIPETTFNCKTQRYKGFFGDPDTNCQVWHYCDLNGGQASFLCPNGTIFSQVALTCDWWYNVKCASTPQLYVLNERLYKYIIPLSPKFPEDYSGPLVDKYLAMKFQEMEEKLKKQKKGKSGNGESQENEEMTDSDETDVEDDASNEKSELDQKAEPTETSVED